MRQLTTVEKIQIFMRELAKAAPTKGNVYFTGGATAVLKGWRESTLDIDLIVVPESDRLLKALVEFKDKQQTNIELACPSHFIPELKNWHEGSEFIAQEGNLTFFHYNLYAQALAKIERFHAQDQQDVGHMISFGLVVPEKLREFFKEIEPSFFKFPAIDPKTFRENLERVLAEKKNR